MKKQYVKYYLAGIVALIAFAVYFTTFQNDFVEWDDSVYVFENPHIRSLDLDFFKWAFFDFYTSNWHPLTWISHALDYAVWGLNPLGHHLTNNILHAVNTFLVVLLVVRLLETGKPSSPPLGKEADKEGIAKGQDKKKIANRADKKKKMPLQKTSSLEKKESSFTSHDAHLRSNDSRFMIHDSRFVLIAASVTGLLFGLHPIHVESVAWVAERKDLLCASFYLLSVMSYLTLRQAQGDNVRVNPSIRSEQAPSNVILSLSKDKHYLLSLLFFTLALLSKPMAVSLPIVLMILDWYPLKRITSFKTFITSFTEKLPFIILSLISSKLTIMAQMTEGAIKSVEVIPLSSRVLVAAKSLIVYLWKMMLPINLTPFYPYPRNIDLFTLEFFLPVALVTGLTIISVAIAKKQKLFVSVWGYYIMTPLPVLGLVQVGDQSMADRYTYLPGLAPFLMIGLLAAWISGKISRTPVIKYAVAAPAVFLLLYLSFLTVKQIEVWKSTFSLWTYVIEKEPLRVPIAYNNRGLNFGRAGLFDKAIEDFNVAINIDPKYPDAYNNRGYAYFLVGQNEKALDDLNKAIELDNNFVKAYENRGSLYLKTGNIEPAISDLQKACGLGHNEACNVLQAVQSSLTKP